MKRPSDPPKPVEVLRAEVIGLGGRSLRKSYYGKLQRHAAEAARFRALLDDASDAILVVELPDYRIVDANRAARKLLGAGDCLVRRPLTELIRPAAWRRFDAAFARSRSGDPVTVRLAGRDLEIAAREDRFDQVRYLVFVARDVTEHRMAARAMQRAKEAAEELARSKSDFLSVASHELRTPITTIQLRLGQATRSADRSPDELVAKLAAPVRRLTAVVDELLEVSRMDRGRVPLALAPVELRSACAEAIDRLRRRLGAERRIDLQPGPAVRAIADRVRLQQVLSNVLENALKYSPPDTRVEARVWFEGGAAHVSVVDHGPGIPAPERRRLFTPFSRLPGTRTVPGLGLGLYVARQIARMQGGELDLGDTPGGGATFTITLPTDVEERPDISL
jgi:two-component system CheB/CheR fusion protein